MSRLGINYGSNINSNKQISAKSGSKTNLSINLVPGLMNNNNSIQFQNKNINNNNNNFSSKMSLNQSLSNDDILLSSTNVTEQNYNN